jgi:hypothetical protein
MKSCPQCNRTYADESLTFCLADGALLSAPYDPETTQRIPPPRSANPPLAEILHPPQHSQPIQPQSGPKFIYAIVAIMAGLVIILASIIIVPHMLQDRRDSNNINQTANINEKSINVTPNNETQRTVDAKSEESPLPTVMLNSTTNTGLPSVPAELTGRWQGQWSSPFGTIFSASVSLESTGTGNSVQGHINWAMRSTPQESKQSKIGLTAVEYVRGSYNSETRLLMMEGYRKDDPNDVITLDKYRLILARDNRSLAGATWNQGRWRGRLALSR